MRFLNSTHWFCGPKIQFPATKTWFQKRIPPDLFGASWRTSVFLFRPRPKKDESNGVFHHGSLSSWQVNLPPPLKYLSESFHKAKLRNQWSWLSPALNKGPSVDQPEKTRSGPSCLAKKLIFPLHLDFAPASWDSFRGIPGIQTTKPPGKRGPQTNK